MKSVKPIPENSSKMIPMLVCRNPGVEIEFCKSAFNAIELQNRPGPDGTIAHSLMTIDGIMLIIESEWPGLASLAPQQDGSSPVVLYLYVEDVDMIVERAVNAGAKILLPLKNQFWGDRTARIMDPSGHVWTLSSRIEEASAEVREKRWSDILEAKPKEGNTVSGMQ